MNIQDVGEKLGIKRADTDAILAEIKKNNAMLDACTGPHDFSIALDRRTLKPVPPDNSRDPFCKWQCSKCCGVVDGIARSWYNKGMKHGELVKKPVYTLGRATIEKLATDSQMQTDIVDFIAASDLFRHNPYEVIKTLMDAIQEFKSTRAELPWNCKAMTDAADHLGEVHEAAKQVL